MAICEEVGVPHRFIKLLVHTARGWMVRGFTSFFSASCPSPDSYARPTQYNAMISLLILSLNPKIRSNLFTTQWDRRECRQYREPSHTGCLNAMLIWSSTYREAYIIQRVWTEAEAAQWYILWAYRNGTLELNVAVAQPYRKEGYSWIKVSKTAYSIDMDILVLQFSIRWTRSSFPSTWWGCAGSSTWALISFRGYGELFDPTQQSVDQEQWLVRLSHHESTDWEWAILDREGVINWQLL